MTTAGARRPRLLASADPALGAEGLSRHLLRLGPLQAIDGLVDAIECCNLRGRGGAGFPVAQPPPALREGCEIA